MPESLPPPSRGLLTPLRAGDLRGTLAQRADVALAALVVVIVGMMIVPLPTALLDILISANIAGAVVLLLVAIYVSDTLKIATFPTILLISTLFRLAIEVSATRLILLHADAGEVIHAFGNFVVAGNLVVGAVIFLILTMIQFIVIAKGSERVAEVGARFTLDAMPGKQMSIDAELRAGHIDQAEARRRRAVLAREAQFFGSMDGAMKFVKGDALAGIVILLVNIVGGLIIGVVQRGMDAATAAHTYTVLTIGEGLVAQIPALIVSTAAGLIVTRVASEEEGGDLGRDIGLQILAQPKAIAIAAGLLVVLAIVPGMPTLPFLILAAALGFVGWRLLKSQRTEPAVAGTAVPAATKAARSGARVELPAPLVTPIMIELGVELRAALAPAGQEEAAIKAWLPRVRERYFVATGMPLPAARVAPAGAATPPDGYAIRLNEVPMAEGRAAAADPQAAQAAIAEHLLRVLGRHGHELFGVQDAQTLLDALERTHPALVREVVPKLVTPVQLTDVLRRLAEEGVSLRHLRGVLEALAEWAPLERDPVALVEHVRGALRRTLANRHVGPGGTLAVYLLDPMIEQTIRESVHKTATGSYLALEPSLSRDILKAAGATLRRGGGADVVLTSAEIRRHVRRLLELEHPDVAVLSYQELPPETKLQPLGRIAVGT